MLKFRSGVGVFLTLLVATIVAVAFWRPWAKACPECSRRASPIEALLSATPEEVSPGDYPFLGEEIIPPVPAPEFDLIDRSGARLSLEDLQGKVVLLSFAYTSCPDVCPVLFGRYLSLQQEFGEAIGQDIALVFITVDPEVDTPERLNTYVESIGGEWHFLTEDPPVMAKVWKDYRIAVEKEDGLVGHSNLAYLIDRDGLIRLRYLGVPPADAFASDIRKLMSQ